MTCPLLDEHLRPNLDDESQDSLARHAESCTECRARLDRLHTVQTHLRREAPALPPSIAHSWYEAVRRPPRPAPPWRSRGFAAAGAAIASAAAIALLVLPARTQDAKPSRSAVAREAWVDLAPSSQVRGEGWILTARTAATVWVPLRAKSVQIARGTVEIGVLAPALTPMVTTPQGEIRLLGKSRIEAQVAPLSTELRVLEGRAQLRTQTGVTELEAGAKTKLRAASTVAAARAPEPQKAPSSPAPSRSSRTLPAAPFSENTGPSAESEPEPVRPEPAPPPSPPSSAPGGPRALEAGLPAASPDVWALMQAADANRRRGDDRGAERLYAEVSTHPEGDGLAEEAMLRRAAALKRLDQTRTGIAVLETAHRRFGHSGLAPERSALLAELYLEGGTTSQAVRALERVRTSGDRVLDKPRLEVATALIAAHQGQTAARLLAPLMARGGPAAEQARRLIAPSPSKRGDPF